MTTAPRRERDTSTPALQAARTSTLLAAAGVALVLWAATLVADALWPVYGLRVAAFTTPASWDGRIVHRQLDTTLSNELLGSEPFVSWPAFSLEWTGALAITDEADYTFSLASDDGSTLELDGALVVDNGGQHLRQRVTGQRHLAPGVYPVRVRYFQAGDHSSFSLLWTRTGAGLSPIPANQWLPAPTSLAAYRWRLAAPLGAALAVVVAGMLALRASRRRIAALGERVAPLVGRGLDAIGQTRVAVPVLLTTAIAARVPWTATPAVLWPDSALFYETMRDIVHGNWLSHDPFRTLLYPQLMAVVLGAWRTPDAGDALITLQHGMGLLTAVLFYLSARRVVSPHVAFAGALAFAVHPLQLFYEVSVLTETLFTCMLALALWLTLRAADSPGVARAGLCGAAIALLVLVRPVAQYYVAWPVAAVALAAGSVRRGVGLALVVLTCYAVPIVPLMALNQRDFGFFGISLGQGLGLYTRVFQIDELAPPANTRYPELRGLWDFARSEAWSANRVHDELNYARDHTAATADAAMYRFAREAAFAQPLRFGLTTAWRWVVQAATPVPSIHVCHAAVGRYLCSGRMTGESLPPFPNAPVVPSPMREAVVDYALNAVLDMRVVLALATVGLVAALRRRERARATLLLAATAAYVVLVPAASQLPQDRYRLPVDALFFVFAAQGAVWFAGRVLDRRVPLE